MAYDIAGNLQSPDFVGNFLAGQRARQQNTLFDQQQQDRVTQQQAAQAQAQQAQQQEHLKWAAQAAQNLEPLIANPEQFNRTADVFASEAAQRGIPLKREEITPEAVTGLLAQLRTRAGMAPPAAPKPAPYVNVSAGGRVFAPQADGSLALVADAPFKPDRPRASDGGGARYRTLTPAEVAAAGLPPNTAAQVGPDGKLQVLSRPPAGGGATGPRPMTAADAKAQREAQAKLPTIAAAERRMNDLAAAIAKMSSNPVFDGGPIDRFGLALTQDGQQIKASAAQLLPTLTALTRIPGIGAQSDLDVRINALQFPSTEYPPAVNAKLVEELQTFIQDLRGAIERTANGDDFRPAASAPAATAAPTAAPAASGGDWVDLGNGIKVKRK